MSRQLAKQPSKIEMVVTKRIGRPYFECQWTDPATGKRKSQSTKRKDKEGAKMFAAKIEQEIIASELRRGAASIRAPWPSPPSASLPNASSPSSLTGRKKRKSDELHANLNSAGPSEDSLWGLFLATKPGTAEAIRSIEAIKYHRNRSKSHESHHKHPSDVRESESIAGDAIRGDTGAAIRCG